MHALFFGGSASSDEGTPLFGWFHPAAQGAASEVGVLVCSPWGREELSAHLSLRQWATQMAKAGYPVLRFDYAGTGDSGGESGTQSLEDWLDSVREAIATLKSVAGVHRVCLLGIRLGASLACLASEGRDDVAGLIAIAPVVRGRAYVRELTALQMASDASGGKAGPDGVDMFQSGGFCMPLTTRDAIASLDLGTSASLLPKSVLVVDRDEMPAAKAWAEVLAQSGAEVVYQSLPGFVAMMDDPHRVVVPAAMVEASIAWLQDKVPTGRAKPLGQAQPLVAEMASAVRLPPAFEGGSPVTEHALIVPGTPAFGLLSTPADASTRPANGILLLNAGSTRHVGPSRTSVELARHWASQGHVVLRLDLAGIGDSDSRPGMPVNQTYPMGAMEDVEAALACLQSMSGVSRQHVIGLCSGAYHALKAARTGLPVASLTLINPLVFFNAEGMLLEDSLENLSPQKVNASASSYRQSLLSPRKWFKLLKGQASLRVLAQVIRKRVSMRLGSHGRDLARMFKLPLKDDLGGELQSLLKRGLKVHFVFASTDPGVAMLREQGGRLVERLHRQKHLDITKIEHADHVFSDRRARRELMLKLTSLMQQLTKGP